ncbi:MAG: aldehyde ferredoxin oxidoreductase [Desulfatitalea sp.]|nr:hypothetical protein [Desulfatitalea sp.]NNK01736.1 aldehyde ferredoxin oxidoreductase [Desulfatitalea sp.]
MEYFGCMGKLLWVDLSQTEKEKQFTEQTIPADVYKEYLTGYGLGAKVLFDNEVYKADPLGPDNVIGFMSGLLTNTGAFFSGRFEVIGKSPLTGGWGDANCGGYFAPAIKKTGYDGILFKNISAKPVYLLIEDGNMELRDAADLWKKKDTAQTQDILQKRHGANYQVACIGEGAENLCRFGAIITDKGRAAARSGLGAIMGSKKLKALCLGANQATHIHDVVTMSTLTGNFMNQMCAASGGWIDDLVSWFGYTPLFSGVVRFLQKHNWLNAVEPNNLDFYGMKRWGTCGTTALSANIGDSPIKNWKGVGYIDFPAKKAIKISNNSVTDHETGKYGCHHCPLRCGGKMNYPKSIHDYPLPKDDDDIQQVHKIEYETSCGFGGLIQCDNLAAIVELNEMCNKASIDTISCSVVVAWAIEAFENKKITPDQTDNIVLEWGNIDSVKILVEKIIKGEGIGKILKEGVKIAAEHFNATQYAMHAGGQELPMHDPRQIGGIGLGIQYEVEPTPGRHTSTCNGCGLPAPETDSSNKKAKSIHRLKGQFMQHVAKTQHNVKNDPVPSQDELLLTSCSADIVNGLGLCLDAFGLIPVEPPLVEWINGATGWNFPPSEFVTIGKRIKTVRHCFNLMCNITLRDTRLPDRARGYREVKGKKEAVLKKGPNAYRMPPIDEGNQAYYEAMGFDLQTGVPSDEVLTDLGLDYVKKALESRPTSDRCRK